MYKSGCDAFAVLDNVFIDILIRHWIFRFERQFKYIYIAAILVLLILLKKSNKNQNILKPSQNFSLFYHTSKRLLDSEHSFYDSLSVQHSSAFYFAVINCHSSKFNGFSQKPNDSVPRMSQFADNESSSSTPGNIVQVLPAVINNDFHARIFFNCLSSRIMGKNLVYNEVIWRTTWSKGGWKVSDIVKVSKTPHEPF